MSLFKPGRVTVQAGMLVKRDPEGRVEKRAFSDIRNNPKKSFRSMLRQITDDGLEQLATLRNIACGEPWQVSLPDGTKSEWFVPTTSERMEASRMLVEYLHGKAVSQTEVLQAEKAADDLEQYKAMSDEALKEAAMPFLERLDKTNKKLGDGE